MCAKLSDEYLLGGSFFVLAGPCVVESREVVDTIAASLKATCEALDVRLVLKASYRKANRSKLGSFTGLGDRDALEILAEVGAKYGLPTVTDIHAADEAAMAAEFVDMLQIPAFLARQTDILQAAGETGKYVNIKKGQFMSGESMAFAAEKVATTGNRRILLTDRGTFFGYQDLVVDFRGIPIMKQHGYPVVMDCTHSLQQPNQTAGVTGGNPEMIETIARAAIAVGADGLFIETHPDPACALSDGANMLRLDRFEPLVKKLAKLRACVKEL